eukprot:TRINITY_DN3187_c0_g8_i1.p1 TRINITY_DN3187_c0_g8~~TRINITY_DN3187_c0_g8_i1.p1  ORF type:complete len:133 (-),score=33.84 TRINITY_DN3187_c0_g8_i1:435-833(-)
MIDGKQQGDSHTFTVYAESVGSFLVTGDCVRPGFVYSHFAWETLVTASDSLNDIDLADMEHGKKGITGSCGAGKIGYDVRKDGEAEPTTVEDFQLFSVTQQIMSLFQMTFLNVALITLIVFFMRFVLSKIDY